MKYTLLNQSNSTRQSLSFSGTIFFGMSEHFPSDEDSEELSESWPTNVTTFGSRASTLTDVDTVVGAELYSTETDVFGLAVAFLAAVGWTAAPSFCLEAAETLTGFLR